MNAKQPVKKPTDRKPKKATVRDVEGGKEVTFPDLVVKDRNGKAVLDDNEKPTKLKVVLEFDALDDYELVEELAQLDNRGDLVPSVLRKLVGDQAEAVVNAHRDERGKAKFSEVRNWILQLLGAFNPS